MNVTRSSLLRAAGFLALALVLITTITTAPAHAADGDMVAVFKPTRA